MAQLFSKGDDGALRYWRLVYNLRLFRYDKAATEICLGSSHIVANPEVGHEGAPRSQEPLEDQRHRDLFGAGVDFEPNLEVLENLAVLLNEPLH